MHSEAELKGSSLSDAQLLDFVQTVLPVGGPKIVVGVVGVDTAQTQELHVAQARDQLARQFAHARDLLLARNPPNKSLAQAYDELGNWTKNRSAVNFLWLWCAEESIWQSIQHAIAYFLEPDEDHEFEEIEITVDQSFIRRERHIEFWLEVLRLGLSNRSTTGRSFMVPTEWRERNHPFCRSTTVMVTVTILTYIGNIWCSPIQEHQSAFRSLIFALRSVAGFTEVMEASRPMRS